MMSLYIMQIIKNIVYAYNCIVMLHFNIEFFLLYILNCTLTNKNIF